MLQEETSFNMYYDPLIIPLRESMSNMHMRLDDKIKQLSGMDSNIEEVKEQDY